MRFACGSCGAMDDHDDFECGYCRKDVRGNEMKTITQKDFKQNYGGSLSNLLNKATLGGKDARERGKYRNIKTEVDGIKFDSLKEAKRYSELKLLEAHGAITDLRVKTKLPLEVNKIKIGYYESDFDYKENGQWIFEDVKSEITRKNPVYRLKKKMIFAIYRIEIKEV